MCTLGFHYCVRESRQRMEWRDIIGDSVKNVSFVQTVQGPVARILR